MNEVAVYDDQLLASGQTDFHYFVQRRKVILAHVDDMPKYLLLPENNQILAAALNDAQHFYLIPCGIREPGYQKLCC